MTDAPAPDDTPTYYLIDGSGFIFRAFHALPMMTRRSDGTPVNAVYGFTAMLMKLLGDLGAHHMAVVFDAARENFRNEIYPEYKANRDEPPEELRPQFGLIRAATEAFNLPAIEVEGYEADDIIATYCRLARERGAKAVVVSSDKDLMQLVGNGISMWDPIKAKPIDEAEVVEKFGVPPSKVVDVQALAGDPVDNVPGVPGIGVKTAAQLIDEYGDLETLLERAGEIKQPKRRETLIENAEKARISKRLVSLHDAVDLPVGLDGLTVKRPDKQALLQFLREMEFRSIVARVEADFTSGVPAGPAETDAAVGDATAAKGVDRSGYVLIQDADTLAGWIARATERGVVAVDTETTGLDASIADLVGISLAVAPGEAAYLPLAHTGGGAKGELDLSGAARPPQMSMDEAVRLLKPLLCDPAVLKVGHNLKYDRQILKRVGLEVEPYDDTMLISYVLEGGLHGHGMDELSEIHLAHRTIRYEEVAGSGKSAVTFDRVPLDRALDYAAEDADVTLRLWQALKPRLVKERLTAVYERIERPMVRVVGDMEAEGIKVDPAVLARLSQEFATTMERLEGEVHRLAGRRFNVGSPKQLGEILFDELGLPGGVKSRKTGAYSTDSGVLEPLAAQGFEIAQKVLDWRQLSKLKGTYTDALQAQINPRTHRVHTSFHLAATNTGRLSSNDPNLQNIPIRTEEGRKIRYAFVAEEGCRLISVDYSQIELRLVAHIAGIEALKEAFRQGQDIHAITASQVFGVPLDQMTPEIRRKAKAINFGIIYGISGFGLAQQLGIDQGEASRFIKAYLERFSELKAWMEATRTAAREAGFVSTLFGRRVHIPGIKDPNPARRGFAERQAINAPIQGTAADIIKRAMGKLPDALADAGLKAHLLLQVHDELVFEAPEAEAEETARIAKAVMEGAAHLDVPLTAESGIGRSWAEAH